MIPSRFLASFVHKRKNALLIVCFLLSAACCTLMSLVKIPVYSVLWCLLFGVFAGPIFPTLLSVSMDAFPGRTARVATIVFGASGIGGMASNVAMGALSDAVGVGDAFFLMSGLALLGAIVYVVTARSLAKGKNRQVSAEK